MTWLRTLDAEILQPHQREHLRAILSNRWSFRVGCRQQAGKSFTLSAAAVALATGQSGDPAHDVVILSKDERTATNLIREVARHVRVAEGWGPIADPKLGSVHRIALRNGRYVQSFPGKPDALQGFTGSVIVDELSKLEAGFDDVMAQALSVSSARPWFRVAVATNADHEGSPIDRFLHSTAMERRRAQWARMNTTIHDVHPDGLPPDVAALRETLSPLAWRRFFLNEFVKRSDGILARHLIEASAQTEPLHVGTVVLSIDPGVARHATGFVVARIGGRVDVLDAGHLMLPDDALEDALCEIAAQHGAQRVVIDPGTQGYLIAKRLGRRLGGIVERGASQQAQDRWAATMQQLLARRAIRIPARLVDLIDDLAALEEQDGHLHAPERPADEPGRVIHCDAALALLALMDEPGVQHAAATVNPNAALLPNRSLERRITHVRSGPQVARRSFLM